MHTLSRRPRRASSTTSEDVYSFGYSPTTIQMLKRAPRRSRLASFFPMYAPGCTYSMVEIRQGIPSEVGVMF
jgi:hypothetical protein